MNTRRVCWILRRYHHLCGLVTELLAFRMPTVKYQLHYYPFHPIRNVVYTVVNHIDLNTYPRVGECFETYRIVYSRHPRRHVACLARTVVPYYLSIIDLVFLFVPLLVIYIRTVQSRRVDHLPRNWR